MRNWNVRFGSARKDKLACKAHGALLGIALALGGLLWAGGTAAAQVNFNTAIYKALADSSSAATIPPGTKITLANWRQYRQFMPIWMQAAYSGAYGWKVGPQPDYTVEVAAPVSYPMPKKFVENTEKYGGQAKLIPTPTGGMTWSGYVAGLPFPNLSGPDEGAKLMYNLWADYRPRISLFYAYNWLVDRFGNVTNLESADAFYRLMHLSEPGFPVDLPFAKGIFYSTRFMVLIPEQSKYTTELTLQPNDPTRLQEVYVFLPSLRRSLRLSSAARCAPILGTDFVEDDNSWMPPNFKFTYLGEKKLLMPVTDYAKAFNRDSYVQPPGSFPGWPKSSITKWELRDQYVVDATWLTSLGSYCYSDRIFYIDAQTWVSEYFESYDKSGKLWKLVWDILTPIPYEGQTTLIAIASISAVMAIDFQNTHITATIESPTLTNDQVPGDYADAAVVTSPGGLDRILR